MKHVVGPWLVGSYDDGVVFGGDSYAIARVIEPIDRPHAKARADANACLIAAAPDLLASCEAMIAADFGAGEWTPGLDALARDMRAAVAKATGMTANAKVSGAGTASAGLPG